MLLLLLALGTPSARASAPLHLSVDEALARLEAQNPALQRADAAVRSAEAGRLQAASALMPTLTGTGSYVRNNAEVTLDLGQLFEVLAAISGQPAPDSPGEIVLQPLDAVTGALALRLPLVNASGWAGLSAAKQALYAAESSAEAQRVNLRSQATQAFYLEAAAESLVEAQTASLERAKELAESAERALNAGTATRLSLLQAQTEAARREGDLLQGRASLDKARLAVGALLGEDGPVAVDLPAPTGAAPVDADAAVQDAQAHRGEVAAARAGVEAAQAGLLSARLGIVPSVSASLAGFASTEAYPTGDKLGWKASVDLTWPIFAGGARLAGAHKASAAVYDAEASLRQAELMVSQQARSAAADLEVAAARVAVAAHQRELAEEGARVAQHSFDEGLVDSAAVLDALDRLDMARVGEIDAGAKLGMAAAALRAAVGQ